MCEVRGEIYMTKHGFLALNKRQAESRRAGVRQSAQLRGRLAAAEGPVDHRVAAARLLRLWLGRDERDAGRHPVRHDQVVRQLRLQHQSADQDVPVGRGAAGISPRNRGAARHARLRHRRRGLQGRPPRLAGAARLRLALAALGDRAQIPGREGDDHRQGHRDPGRPHRRADAGRQARAGDRRRRRGAERDAAQCRRDRAARCPHRRYGDDPARRRRHSAGARCRAGEAAARRQALRVSEKVSVPSPHRRRARADGDGRGGRGRALQRRVRLPVSGRGASQALRVPPRLRYRWARREADRAVL